MFLGRASCVSQSQGINWRLHAGPPQRFPASEMLPPGLDHFVSLFPRPVWSPWLVCSGPGTEIRSAPEVRKWLQAGWVGHCFILNQIRNIGPLLTLAHPRAKFSSCRVTRSFQKVSEIESRIFFFFFFLWEGVSVQNCGLLDSTVFPQFWIRLRIGENLRNKLYSTDILPNYNF